MGALVPEPDARPGIDAAFDFDARPGIDATFDFDARPGIDAAYDFDARPGIDAAYDFDARPGIDAAYDFDARPGIDAAYDFDAPSGMGAPSRPEVGASMVHDAPSGFDAAPGLDGRGDAESFPDADAEPGSDGVPDFDGGRVPDALSATPTRVLILGNSITHHKPLPSVGWYGDWGMAASTADKDFVHQLIAKLEKTYSPLKFEYREQNIAAWELDFFTDLDAFTEIKGYSPDLLIVRLGENVVESYAEDNNYYAALYTLINHYKVLGTKVVVTGNFWPSVYKDDVQRSVAVDNKYSYVDLSPLQQDENNKAIGCFQDCDVAEHPSDFGMKNIADLIFGCIFQNQLIKSH